MAIFGREQKLWGYEITREGEDTIVRINCADYIKIPSIEDDPVTMSKACEILIEVKNATKLIFSQKRDYDYDFTQTRMLAEIAFLYNKLLKQKNMFSMQALGFNNQRYADVQSFIMNLISDPLSEYVKLRRMIRQEKINHEKTLDEKQKISIENYITLLINFLNELEKTRIITLAKPYLEGHRIGERDIYRRLFRPTIKPDFMFTKLMASYPREGVEIGNFTIADETEVTVFKFPDSVQYLYHMMPPEFKLDEERYELVDMARKVMAEHKPEKTEFTDPARMREVFYNVGHDLIEELATYKNIKISSAEIEKLTRILVRYTIGFGLIEVLLQDDAMQDISLNSPMGHLPMFIVHGEYGDCKTNIIPTREEAESWASKLRMISGRPLDEANPILDTELELPGASIRVSAITEPLDPTGLAFSFRRHRDRPWTLPLFIKYKMITPLAAGLLSFLIDGTRSMLIAGTRSSGKSSFLSSLLIEIMRRYRIITVEDTLELPARAMLELGFNIQQMKVASALARSSTEMSASDGIRSTLRLGDSSLIVGEVRSSEAKALYEAMRVGAAANVVAGTIHGDSPYGIFDRVVNDIGVPATSFKATDIIIIANPIKAADGIHKNRRVTQITEVRKDWEHDPNTEGGFVDLMKYDAKTDAIEPTDDLINGESEVLKSIAGNIKEFAGNWDAVWQNIELRAKIKEKICEYSKKLNDDEMLEAPFVIRCNDRFHNIVADVQEQTGGLDSKRILFEYDEWLKRECKKRGIK